METLRDDFQEFKTQLRKGAVPRAYRSLMQFTMDLRAHFARQYPDCFVSGSLYTGYMDMTYFSFIPPALKARGLKAAVVFVYESFRFEVWLAAVNKQVQKKYWNLFRGGGWTGSGDRIVPSPQGYDGIIERVLAADPDFGDMDALNGLIEAGTLKFIQDVEGFLAVNA